VILHKVTCFSDKRKYWPTADSPRRYFLTIVLIICPASSSIRYLPSFNASYPSCPSARYSLVTTLYVLPPFSRFTSSTGSWLRFTGADWVGVTSPEVWVGVSVVLSLISGSRCTLRTRCPGGRRESHTTQNPERTGNRLEIEVS